MTQRRLGASGLLVSAVGLGCNNFGHRIDAEAATRVVHAALDHGISLFDTADIYGQGRSEEMLGAALRGHRDDVVIATKFAIPTGSGPYARGGSRSYILRAAEASLRRLGTDHIDLYQMHVPDPATPIDETLAALDMLVRAGKVRYLGSSNFAAWEIAEAAAVADRRNLTPFVSAQNHYSLLERGVEVEVVPACAHFGVGLLPYFPLAGGLLTGKYRLGEPPPVDGRLKAATAAEPFLTVANLALVDDIRRFAQERAISVLDVAVGWLAAQPQVASVIAGATRPEQVAANVAASGYQPTADDLTLLDRLAPINRTLAA